ncbi:MAG: type IX secretion system outer membrane channel protein PorV [Bacteroidales bacterium]|nr:type IX secretion system outer membrane channel protein PorV [Bacteroidales bacterium]
MLRKTYRWVFHILPWLRHLQIKDINLIYMAGSYKLDKMQALSMSILYFSLGDIQYTDERGDDLPLDHNPNEWAMDFAYSRKLSDVFALGISGRFIYSNLLGSIDESKPGIAAAADISGMYQKSISNIGDISWGFNISNIGSKISYQDGGEKDFIPTNLRLGGGYNFNLNEYNKLGIYVDYNKLLVPTEDSSSSVSTVAGVFTSFSDAPGGFKEEIHEIIASVGVEYWYDNQFAIRGGYFYEHETKGNRKYFSLGVGLKLNVFGLDVSYLVANGNSPLANTLRFSLSFDFEGLKAENKAAENI